MDSNLISSIVVLGIAFLYAFAKSTNHPLGKRLRRFPTVSDSPLHDLPQLRAGDWPCERQRIAVEGNIGCGKSTLLQKLRQCETFQAHVLEEPVDQWSSIKDKATGKNILESYYADPKKWAFPFQLVALQTRTRTLQRAYHYPYVLYERSIVADRCVFAKLLSEGEDALIEPMEFEIYLNLWNMMSEQTLGVCPTRMIYIRTEPEQCAQRIAQRARSGEEKIPMEYLQRLHQKHEQIFSEDTLAIPTLVIDGSQDWKNDNAVFEKIARQINEFVYGVKVK